MPISTGADLKATITDYLAQDDVANQLNTFIRFAEVRMNREIRHTQMQTTPAAADIPADGKVQLPADFLELSSHAIQADAPFTPEYVPENIFRSLVANAVQGIPRTYTVVGDEFWFAPVPDASYPYEFTYFQEVPSLIFNPQNWLLRLAPDLYLYACLLEAAPYLVDDTRISTWQQLYVQGRASLMNLDQRKKNRPSGVMRSYRSGRMERRNRWGI